MKIGKSSELTFQALEVELSASSMPKIVELGSPVIVVCSVDGLVAAQRHLQRGLVDPSREFFHGDERVSIYSEDWCNVASW